MLKFALSMLAALLCFSGLSKTGFAAERQSDLPLADIRLPPGFNISIFARVPGARQMCLSSKGALFVGTRDDAAGKVYAVVDDKMNHDEKRVLVIASGLDSPNGVALKDGALYIGAIHRILRLKDIEQHLDKLPPLEIVDDTFPRDKHHGWKYIRFGPDGWLYVPVGAPCNVCERKDDERYATIMCTKLDGSPPTIFARGVRNTVGFDWDPKTKELWFTDNGRDWLGDNSPPDELNHAPHKGMHFGFPYFHGRNIADPQFGKGHSASEFTLPAVELGPHVAALGMRFYNGTMFPSEYRGDIFIAEHGSWNRSKKIGYRVTRVHFQGGQPVSYTPFAEGWLKGEQNWGRPVDINIASDGSMLLSDDQSGTIYRITYQAADQ